MKKLLTLIAVLMVALLTACNTETESSGSDSDEKQGQGQSENINETGMPIVNEKISLEIFAGKSQEVER